MWFNLWWGSGDKKKEAAPVDQYKDEKIIPIEELVAISDEPLEIPTRVIQRINKEYLDDPELLAEAQVKLAAIKMRAIDPIYANVVEIWGRIFSMLHLDVTSKDVYQWVKQFDHITYAKAAHRVLDWHYEEPYTLLRLVEKSGKKIFDNIVQAEGFMEQYLPGKTKVSRVQNFADLIGLMKGWYCNPYGFWTNLKMLWYAWISPPFEGMAGSIYFSEKEGGFFFHYLDLALPIVCFKEDP